MSSVLPAGLKDGAQPTGGGVAALAAHPNFFISQTRRGCLQEMLGCEARNEFNISTMEQKQAPFMYALEDSSFLCRLCCANLRESRMDIKLGSMAAAGPQIMSYERPFQCLQVGPCKCCCYQQMSFFDETNTKIGHIKEDLFFCFVPSFTISEGAEAESPAYTVQMPVCCMGLCVDVCAEGLCNCRIPFYIYPVKQAARGNELQAPDGKPAQITKVWSGTTTELFTDADNFELVFPTGATPNQKALLLGSVFFLNMNFFEKQKNQN